MRTYLCLLPLFSCTSQQLDSIDTASDASSQVCSGIAGLDSTDPAILRAQQACDIGARVVEAGAAVGGCREAAPVAPEASPAAPPAVQIEASISPDARLEAAVPSPVPAASPLPAGN
jgi:hypothetical protein